MIFKNIQKRLESSHINRTAFGVFLFLLIAILISYIWICDMTNDFSIDLIRSMEENTPKLMSSLSLLSNRLYARMTTSLIGILILNYSNIFLLYIIYSISFLSIGISTVINLSYRVTMLFIHAEKQGSFIEPLNCDYAWASVSPESVLCTSVSLTIWLILRNPKSYGFFKVLGLILTSLIIAFYNFCIFCSRNYSIMSLAFSTLIGFYIFSFYFIVMNLDLTKSRDLKKFLEKSKMPHLLINFLLIASIIALYLLNLFVFTEEDKFILDAISHTSCFFEYPKMIKFSFSSLIYLSLFITNMIMLLGVYLDIKYLNFNDESSWGYFNFNNDLQDLESFYTFNDEVKAAQWNNTSFYKTILRLLLSFLIIGMSIVPSILIKYNRSSDITVLVFKFFLPYSLEIFSIFFILKFVFIKLRLIKTTLIPKSKRSAELHLSD